MSYIRPSPPIGSRPAISGSLCRVTRAGFPSSRFPIRRDDDDDAAVAADAAAAR